MWCGYAAYCALLRRDATPAIWINCLHQSALPTSPPSSTVPVGRLVCTVGMHGQNMSPVRCRSDKSGYPNDSRKQRAGPGKSCNLACCRFLGAPWGPGALTERTSQEGPSKSHGNRAVISGSARALAVDLASSELGPRLAICWARARERSKHSIGCRRTGTDRRQRTA